MDNLSLETLEASIANPNDQFEVDLIADVASVGITDELYKGGKKIDWTEETLAATADSLIGMPINLKFVDERTGEIDPHSTTVIGRVSDVTFDRARKKLLAKGKLWKHYFPDTIKALNDMYADDQKKPQTSIEFNPTEAEYPSEGVIRPLAGRFSGLGIVNKGADRGNFVHLLASAKKEEANMKMEESRTKGVPLPGTFEWIGENLVTHLNASASTTDYSDMNVVGTYPDRAVWYSNNTYYMTPYTIDRTSIEFGDTIEVEQDFKPLSAATEKSEDTPPTEPQKEAIKPMAEINETELEALKASAKRTSDLEKELETLKASAKQLEDDLQVANDKVAEAEKREEDARLEKLAAARIEEVEKIQKYESAEDRKEAAESFKTMDEKTFEFVKKTLQAAAAPKGGVTEDERITNPFESRQDTDGEAAKFIQSDDFKRLVASASATKEDK